MRAPGGGGDGDGVYYYWNRSSGETTAVGEPVPGPEGRVAHYHHQQRYQQPVAARGAAFNLVGYPLLIGLGFGAVAGVLRLLF